MKILLNSYNTTAAGTSAVTDFALKELLGPQPAGKGGHRFYFMVPDIYLFRGHKGSETVKIIRLPVFRGAAGYIFRGFYDLLFLPIVSFVLQSAAVIILANYSPAPVCGRKIVFMRHPYLIEKENAKAPANSGTRLETLRRAVFRMTLFTADALVVQSGYAKRRLLERYGGISNVQVLPNPVSNRMALRPSGARSGGNGSRDVLYVSRFYPHKRHAFLLELAHRYREELRREGVRFFVTINPSDPGGRRFLEKVENQNLSDIVCNIGEVPNEELAVYYQKARCLFFPSRMETFGNPLVEAMAFHLPVVVPDLGYAHSVCGECGIYFRPDDVRDAYQKLRAVLSDESVYNRFSAKCAARCRRFPTVSEWLESLLALAGAHGENNSIRSLEQSRGGS